MAGFILYDSKKIKKSQVNNARKAFHNKPYDLEEQKFTLGDFELYYYSKFKDNRKRFLRNKNSDLLCACGSLLYKGKADAEALKLIYEELKNGKKLYEIPISGNYVLLVFFQNELLLMRDLFGGEVCYTNEENTWFTTNFLSALALIPNRIFRKQESLEYLLYGFVFGDVTFIEGIKLLSPIFIHNIKSQKKQKKQITLPHVENNYKKCLEKNLNALLYEFSLYKSAFGNNVISALSGGFDSRLMLALQLKEGINPNLYVYGKDSHPEVMVAKEITKSENLKLLHVNKSNYEIVPLTHFKDVMKENLWGLDGFVNVGLIGDQSDLKERLNRGKTNGILLNGAGGEIYRDVWQWDFRKTTIKYLFEAAYNTGELPYLGINEKDFFDNIELKLSAKFKDYIPINKYITRQQAEMVFPIYRANFYYSNNTIDNYFSNSHLPYLSKNVTLQSFSIPSRFKKNGKFEMDLISKLSPRLAAYKSSYGFNFIKGQKQKEKIINFIYRKLSPKHKSRIKKITGKSKKSLFNPHTLQNRYLDKSYLSEILDLKNLHHYKYLDNTNEIKNSTVINRLYSLEFLSQKFNIIW